MIYRARLLAAIASAVSLAAISVGAVTADGGATTDDVYGYADFYGIPHLGTETVSGSGCGGDGSIGDVIPDGYWRGYVAAITGGTLQIDLVCVYGDDVDPALVAEWTAQHPGQPQPWVPDGFMVNNSDRLRSVPTAPTFIAHGAAWTGSSCLLNSPSTPPEFDRDVWIRIVGGQAQWAVSSCTPAPGQAPSGPSAPGPTGYTFPYATFYDVPRLGVEEVLGTGCGGNGSLGDTIPDGIWFGWIDSLGPSSLQFDVACIYTGAAAARYYDEYHASPELQADDPSPYLYGSGLWLINNNDRTRTVPLAPGYVTAVAAIADPTAPHPNWPSAGIDHACVPPIDPTITPAYYSPEQASWTGAWLQITNGQAQYALLECPHD